jgi:hypothetical protein
MFFIFKKEDEEILLNVMYTTDLDVIKEWIMTYLTKYLEEFEVEDSRESKKKNQYKIYYTIEELNSNNTEGSQNFGNKFIVRKNYTQIRKGPFDLFNTKLKESKVICEIRIMKSKIISFDKQSDVSDLEYPNNKLNQVNKVTLQYLDKSSLIEVIIGLNNMIINNSYLSMGKIRTIDMLSEILKQITPDTFNYVVKSFY